MSLFSVEIKRFALLSAVATVGCFLPSEPDRPRHADISIEGNSAQDFELVVSTAFYEALNEETAEIQPVLLAADTSHVRLPHASTVQLTDHGMVLVRVTNIEESPAEIRLRVILDTGVAHDELSMLDIGDSHTYYFMFNRNGGRR